ncbi:MAG: hypothetical protein IIZ92_00130 [Aquincola sp.]|nr:hypothetical protein [Aquincola sp.]
MDSATTPVATVAARPVQLQCSASGRAWRPVLSFDAANGDQETAVLHFAARLGDVDPRTTWRIVTDDALAIPLMTWSKTTGWRVA